MPLSFHEITIGFEQITTLLLILSIVLSLIFGLKLYTLHALALSRISHQDDAIGQLALAADKARDAADLRLRDIDSAISALSVSTVERLGQQHKELLTASIGQTAAQHETLRSFQDALSAGQRRDFQSLEAKIEAKLDAGLHKISHQVMADFEANLKSSQQAVSDVVARLARIDAAQQKIEDLSRHVVSLQDVLADKKARGAFGETQLSHLLAAALGDCTELYSIQHTLPNQRVADVMMHLPEPVGNVAVDAKFPLENYQRMMDRKLPAAAQKTAAGEFTRDFKKHIDAIAERYILAGYTSKQAILFLPAEAIFAELHSRFQSIVSYAQSRRVWIVSPTTFMAQLSTIQIVVSNLKREKYAHIIQSELQKLATEFSRYKERWAKLGNQLATVSKSVSELNITTDKITRRFDQINEVNLPKIDS